MPRGRGIHGEGPAHSAPSSEVYQDYSKMLVFQIFHRTGISRQVIRYVRPRTRGREKVFALPRSFLHYESQVQTYIEVCQPHPLCELQNVCPVPYMYSQSHRVFRIWFIHEYQCSLTLRHFCSRDEEKIARLSRKMGFRKH